MNPDSFRHRLSTPLLRRVPELLAALAGLAWFLLAGGYRAIRPTSLDWLADDTTQHVMGWLFFRQSHWALPLGRIDGFVWPTGTTVGFTDSNPLLAIPLKLLSGLLPTDFQYVGLWLAACFALQGWAGARVAALASNRPLDQLLGGILFAISPPLLARVRHDTLCAHFCIVALLVLYLRPVATPTQAHRTLLAASTIPLALAAVHPYLVVMTLGPVLALLVKLCIVDNAVSVGTAGRAAAALLLGPLGLLALFGYFTTAPSHAGGFGIFSSDLLALINPGGTSWILPPLPATDGQWEGNAYLGLGGILLTLLSGYLALARWRPTRHEILGLAPLLTVCALFLVFALSNVVRAAGREVLDLRGLYASRLLSGFTGPFRSSGRFAWPAYYLLLAGAVLGVLSLLRRHPSWATGLLVTTVALQLVDLTPKALDRHLRAYPWRPQDPAWRLAHGEYDHMALVPPQIFGYAGSWRETVYGNEQPWRPLSYQAYALGMTINSGYVARGSCTHIERSLLQQEQELEAGLLDERTVYVVHDSQLPTFKRAGALCGRLDGFTVCVRPTTGRPFAAALANREVPRETPGR